MPAVNEGDYRFVNPNKPCPHCGYDLTESAYVHPGGATVWFAIGPPTRTPNSRYYKYFTHDLVLYSNGKPVPPDITRTPNMRSAIALTCPECGFHSNIMRP